ncbi:phosphoribosylformylglycinamidine synthase subunit PurL [Kallotenue papyrolyticum]|uniref:phosphoribosylformylglycinamidine synthase subunit PurL n=1 Tax=Kallotenue papyrolyticum TaxID=1325125 RepID=UPI000492DF6B|nr:phosphoribosylformylglycinamidine synthase subunit PurL [Kallotenue papyrolyticum]
MPIYLVAVRPRQPEDDRHLISAAHSTLGLQLHAAYTERRYLLAGALDGAAARRVADELLADPLLTTPLVFELDALQPTDPDAVWAIDIAYRPGVTDNEGESLRLGAARAGIAGLENVRTLRRVYLRGELSADAVEQLATTLLANDLVEAVLITLPEAIDASIAFYRKLIAPPPPQAARIASVPLRDADDAELLRISREGVLALDLDEMRAIQAYFRGLGRDPTDGELETLAQTWSEHCSHKTFKARILYSEQNGPHDADEQPHIPAEIDGLLKTLLIAETRRINPPWLVSAFVDNAGIIRVGDQLVSFKVETHNHPSALEPFGGANTGVGGVVRDILGVSAQPIANLDVLCFGPQDLPAAALPPGVLHPRRVAEGVVAGIRDYGNKLGIPTVAGAVIYDAGYTCNPLVFCGTVGLSGLDQHRTGAQPGDAVVVIGGRTGRDGIHGATFSSEELTHATAEVVGTAVQIGDPITEKRVIDVVLQARDRGLYRAITDCGAGGLSSAVGEMGERTGVRVELANVPLKYPGLQPWEVWLSEAQERMVLAVPPATLEAFLQLCREEEVEATVIGHFTADRRLTVTYQGQTLVDLEMAMLHEGRPQRLMRAVWTPPTIDEPPLHIDDTPLGLRLALHRLLSHPNIATKEPIVRSYDHLVQGRTVQGPLGGVNGDAPTDAAVIHLRHDRPEALAIGCGINPRYGLIDPYWMALAACDEAIRNVVAVGADPYATALLDNFCWGDPREPDRLAGLVRAAVACRDVAQFWSIPFISGKDSLNNEYRDADGRRVPIPPTLLISALGVIPDVTRVVTPALKRDGNLIYLLGRTRNELGGSHYLLLQERLGQRVPRVDLAQARRTFRALHAAIRAGLVQACHDLSEGGLAVAAAEMMIAGGLGLDLDLAMIVRDEDCDNDALLLFSETPSRFLVEVRPEDSAAFGALMEAVEASLIGFVTNEPILRVDGLAGVEVLRESLDDLRRSWRGSMAQLRASSTIAP